MRPQRSFSAIVLGVSMLTFGSTRAASAQASVAAQCVVDVGSTCTLIRFLITSGIDPVALTTFAVDFEPGSGWLFSGGPTGAFTAEDDFSFGAPYGGSTSITNGGRSLFVAFVSPPTFELVPFSVGAYIEVAASGGGDTDFKYTATDPDAVVISDNATLSDPLGTPITSTPEPGTILLVATGLAALLRVRSRRVV